MGYIGPKEPPVITPGTITNSDLANVSQYTIKGRVTTGSGSPENLTADQAITLLNQASAQALNAARVNSYYRTLRVNGGADLTQRSRINFIPGTGVSISGADDAVGDESDLTVALAAIANNRVLGNTSGSSAAPTALDSDALFAVINSTGTAQLANNRLAPLDPSPAGTYSRASVTVDAQGRITAAANGGLIVNTDISASAEIAVSKLADGAARQLLQTDSDGTGVEWTSNVDVPGTLDVTGVATFDNNVTVQGNLTVNGTTTTINTEELLVEDKNIIIANVTSPTDVTADGGGITLKGATDKTLNWVDATDSWTSSEHLNLASGKSYRINGTEVLSSTALGANVLITSSNITNGTIVNEDVNASAAIAGTKIAPDFGAQNVTTTGTSTAASFNPTSATVPTNGVYLPAANSVGISTNGTGRLFVDASGRVGVGVASPAQTFQVRSTSGGTTARFENTSSGNFIDFQETTGGTRMGYVGHATATEMYVHNDKAGPLIFDTSNTERLRITSAGLVGIGSSTPSALLELGGSIALGTTRAIYARYPGDSANPARTALEITANESGTEKAAFRVMGDGSIQGNNYAGTIFRNSSGTEIARFDTSNRLGIGTTSPSTTLEVSKASNNLGLTEIMRLGGTAAASNDGWKLSFFQSGSGEVGYLGYYYVSGSTWNAVLNSTHNIEFRSGNTERARVDSSGRLLVGTSTASTFTFGGVTPRFQVEGTDASTGAISIARNSNDANGAGLIISKSRGTTAGSNTIVANNDTIADVLFEAGDGTQKAIAGSIGCFVDGTPGANDMPGRLVFSTTADGASSPTERLRITSTGQVRLAGAGITFNGDTATANELDDYEEGTWTPFIGSNNGNDSSITQSDRSGSYVKIGNRVFAFFKGSVNCSNFTPVAGPMALGGLPFTPSSNAASGGHITRCDGASTNVAGLQYAGTTSYAGFAHFRIYPYGSLTAIDYGSIFPSTGVTYTIEGAITYTV